MKKIFLSTMITVTLFGTASLSLQASEKRSKGNFKRADINKDEKVSKEEFEKSYRQRKMAEEKIKTLWELSDSDKDNILTIEEWINGRQAMHKNKSKEKK